MRKLNAYWTYLALEGVSSLIFTVVFTVNMIYQIEVAGLSPLQLVLIGTVLETTIFLFEIPTGVVADVYSRRLSVIIGVCLIGSGFLLEGSIPRFWAIALAQVLWGLGYTFTSGATQAWISDEIGEERAGQAFLRGNQLGMGGSLLGIGLGVLLGNVRVNLPIQSGGLAFLVLGILLLLLMPETGFSATPRGERNSWQNMAVTFRQGLGMVRKRPILLTILAIGLFYGLYSEGYDRLWAKHLLESFTLPELGRATAVNWFGIINASELVLGILVTELVKRRVNLTKPAEIMRVMLAGSVGIVLGLVVFANSSYFGLAVAMVWLIGVARQINGPLYMAWVNQRLDSQVRATVLSMSSQVDAIGQIAGGPMLGVIGNVFSVRAAMTTAAGILSPVIGILYFAARGQSKIASAPDELPVR